MSRSVREATAASADDPSTFCRDDLTGSGDAAIGMGPLVTDDSTFGSYLDDHADSAELLDALRRCIAGIGPTEERLTKSQVAFRRRRTVASAWAPGQHLGNRGAPLVLTLELPHRDPSPRWKEVVEPRPGRFTHHLELRDAADLDDEVVAWLRAAWEAAG